MVAVVVVVTGGASVVGDAVAEEVDVVVFVVTVGEVKEAGPLPLLITWWCWG